MLVFSFRKPRSPRRFVLRSFSAGAGRAAASSSRSSSGSVESSCALRISQVNASMVHGGQTKTARSDAGLPWTRMISGREENE